MTPLEGEATVFDRANGKRQKVDETLIAQLYQQIGLLKGERDFLQSKSNGSRRSRTT